MEADDHRSGDRSGEEDLRLAGLILPTVDDLWGPGWRPATEDGEGGAGGGLGDDCLPGDFPDAAVTSDAGVTFRRAGAVVDATSVIFRDVTAARTAWDGLAAERFARCFAESVAASVAAAAGAPGDAAETDLLASSSTMELLGPVVPPSNFGVDRDRRVATHRAVFSAFDEASVLPLALESAVVTAGRAVVVLWAFDPWGEAVDEGWCRLVERVVRRCEAARVAG